MVAIFVCLQERDQLKNTITYLLPDLALTYPKYQLWSCSSVDPYSFLSSYLPSLPLPPLSFLPFSPSTRWTTNKNGISSSDTKPSKLTYSQAAWGLGSSLHVYRTAFAIATTEGASMAWPTREGKRHWRLKRKKNDRDRSTLTAGNSLPVHSSRRSNPGKIWIPANQIRVKTPRAHVSREIRARALQASRGI